MIKTVAAAISCALFLGACSKVTTGQAPEALAAQVTSTTFQDDPLLTQTVSIEQIVGAVAALDGSRPVTVALTRTWLKSFDDHPPFVSVTTTESATSSPDSPIVHVVVDDTEVADFFETWVQALSEETVGSAGEDDREEGHIDASPIVAMAMSQSGIVVEYYIDQRAEQTATWIKMEDRLQHQEDEMRALSLVYGGFYEYEALADVVHSVLVDFPELSRRWAEEPYSDRPEFLGGLGLELTPQFGQQLASSLLGDDDSDRVGDLIVTEYSRTSSRIVMELASKIERSRVLVGFDADLDIIFIEETKEDETLTRLDFDWNPDPAQTTLPPEADRLSEQDVTDLNAVLEERMEDFLS